MEVRVLSDSQLILASTSPYRKELLEKLKIPFQCMPSQVDEDLEKEKTLEPVGLSQKLAFQKANSVFQKNPDATVIGSDQVAFVDQTIFDKPTNFDNAFKQLSFLSDKTHYLVSAVCIIKNQKVIEFQNQTALKMKALTDQQIRSYLHKDQPFDCAGSYKIESLGISLFEKIECSDFTSIIGLPLIELTKSLNSLGYKIP